MTHWCSLPVTWELRMHRLQQTLGRRYATVLRMYLVDRREAALEEAYEIGRLVIAGGLGVLDLARLHQNALASCLRNCHPNAKNRVLEDTEVFFLQSLSPFEAVHRGFRETNSKLQDRNRALELEIAERTRTEKALRELFNEARQMEERLRNLSNRILHAHEEERKRISRELHDDVGQALTAISVILAAIESGEGEDPARARRKIAEAQQLLQMTAESVHDFARELRPAILDDLGLLPALRSQLKAFANRTGLRVSFRGNVLAEKLDGDQKTVLYRIAQESLNNVAKHARAVRVDVVLRKAGDAICMEVADDGKSFHGDHLVSGKEKQRLGLLGMQERVRLVNGGFAVKTQPGQGTTVRVTIPFQAIGKSLAR